MYEVAFFRAMLFLIGIYFGLLVGYALYDKFR